MKQALFIGAIASVFATNAYANNIVTSKTYVDNRDNLKVDIAQGVGTNNANVGKTLVVNSQGNLELGTPSAGNYVEDSITDGVTTKAPSENAVHDALADKQDTITTAEVEFDDQGNTASVPALLSYDSTNDLTGNQIGFLDLATYVDLNSGFDELPDNLVPSVGLMDTMLGDIWRQVDLKQNRQIGASPVGNANSTDAGKVLVVGNDGKIAMGTTMPDTSNFQTKIPATEWQDGRANPIPGVVISTDTDGVVEQRMILDKTQDIRDNSIDNLVKNGEDVFDIAYDIHDDSVTADDVNAAVPTTTMTVAIANAAAKPKQNRQIGAAPVGNANSTDAGKVLVVGNDGKIAMGTTSATGSYQPYTATANQISGANGTWKSLGTTLDTTDATNYDADNAVKASVIVTAMNTKQTKKTCAGWLDGTTVADATHTDANCVLWNLPD